MKLDPNILLTIKVFPWAIQSIENDINALQGKGGYGKVLRAFDATLEKDIAIKMIELSSPENEDQEIAQAIDEFMVQYDL